MDEQYPKAKAVIEKALSIDPNLAEAHSFLGEIMVDFEGDFAGAENEHHRAIALDPNSSVAHRTYALTLTYLGRHDEAIAESKTAIDLEPSSVINQLVFGRSLLFARRYNEAITVLERAAEMDPEYFFVHQSLSVVYHLAGDDGRAFESLMKAWTYINVHINGSNKSVRGYSHSSTLISDDLITISRKGQCRTCNGTGTAGTGCQCSSSSGNKNFLPCGKS